MTNSQYIYIEICHLQNQHQWQSIQNTTRDKTINKEGLYPIIRKVTLEEKSK